MKNNYPVPIIKEFFDQVGNIQFEYSIPKGSEKITMKSGGLNYTVHEHECLITIHPGTVSLPDFYFIGPNDPRNGQTKSKHGQGQVVPLGSLWHDTDVGLLKELVAFSGSKANTTYFWENTVGEKYVVNIDTVVGKIIPKVDICLNPGGKYVFPKNIGEIVNTNGLDFSSLGSRSVRKHSLSELLDKVEKDESLFEEE